MTSSRQCAILAGGSGTRLGELTKDVPKPLLPVGGRPFVAHLINEVARHGFGQVLLLAGTKVEAFNAQIDSLRSITRRPVDIRVLGEAQPLGTGGAVKAAAHELSDEFLLLNGDSFFDFNLLDLAAPLSGSCLGRLALKPSPDVSRYGAIAVNGERITKFTEKGAAAGHGTINGGAYWLRRKIVDDIGAGPVSLEIDVLPRLAASGRLLGRSYDRFFIDIGIPEALRDAQSSVPAALARPAVFFIGDTLLAQGRSAGLDGGSEAISAIRWLNDNGYYAFLLARDDHAESGHFAFHARMEEQLSAEGAHIDSCEYLPRDRGAAARKVQDLAKTWSVRCERSLIVGHGESGADIPELAGAQARLFDGGDMLQFIRRNCGA